MLDCSSGRYTVDRFATDYNTKCSRFNSKYWCRGTEAIDAFTQNWTRECNWVVPPPNLISRAIRKFCDDKAEGTLVVPLWTSAPYWVLLHKTDNNCMYFVKNKQILTHENLIVTGRGNNGAFANTPLKFKMVAFRIRF